MTLKKKLKRIIHKYKLLNFIRKEVEYKKRYLNEILWGSIFNNTISESDWLKKRAFSPGRWALGYPALYLEYRILNDTHPKCILEFGLGESSKMTAQYIHAFTDAELIIIEQNKDWLTNFSENSFDVSTQVKILPIIKKNYKGHIINIYDGLLPAIQHKKFDFIIVDGPWGSSRYSRHQIVDVVDAGLLADDFVIMIDDYDRYGEMQTADELLALFDDKQIPHVKGFYLGTADTFIVCSPKYRFLTSL